MLITGNCRLNKQYSTASTGRLNFANRHDHVTLLVFHLTHGLTTVLCQCILVQVRANISKTALDGVSRLIVCQMYVHLQPQPQFDLMSQFSAAALCVTIAICLRRVQLLHVSFRWHLALCSTCSNRTLLKHTATVTQRAARSYRKTHWSSCGFGC